jgi:hypothetical protein
MKKEEVKLLRALKLSHAQKRRAATMTLVAAVREAAPTNSKSVFTTLPATEATEPKVVQMFSTSPTSK